MTIAAPLQLWRETVRPEWIDYNGHMNVAYYVLILDHAVDALWEYLGIGRAYRDARSGSVFAVEAHVTYARELLAGADVRVETRLIGFDEKRIHYYHEIYHAEDGFLAATGEFLSLHVDLDSRKVTPFAPEVLARLAEVQAAHDGLPRPERLGRTIGVPGR
jgi:acyl-CoA thioester hydrolase